MLVYAGLRYHWCPCEQHTSMPELLLTSHTGVTVPRDTTTTKPNISEYLLSQCQPLPGLLRLTTHE